MRCAKTHAPGPHISNSAGARGPIVTSDFEATVDFGGGDLKSAGGLDVFVAEYAAAGSHKQSVSFGGAGDEAALAIARDKAGGFALGGFTTGSVNFGNSILTSVGGRDGFITKLDSKLAGKWSRRYGDVTFYQTTTAIACGPLSEVVAGGYFSGKANFGSGILTSAGSTDFFVVKYPL